MTQKARRPTQKKAARPKAKVTSRLRPEPNGSGTMKFIADLSSLEIDPNLDLYADSVADHILWMIQDYVFSKSQNPESYVITVEEV